MLSATLNDKVLQFVESEITLPQLEEWLVPRLPFFLREPYTDDANVASAIELCLAEVNDGIKTSDESRDFLKSVLSEHTTIAVHAANISQLTTTSSANRMELVRNLPTYVKSTTVLSWA